MGEFKLDDITFEYDIKNDSLFHHTQQATLYFGIPQRIKHMQDYFLKYRVIMPDSAKNFLNAFREISAGAQGAQCVVHAATAKGVRVWIEITLSAVFDNEGKPNKALGVIKDVTKKWEDNLRLNNIDMYRDVKMREAFIYFEANLTKNKMTVGLDSVMKSAHVPATESYDEALSALVNIVVLKQDRPQVINKLSSKAMLNSYKFGESSVEIEYRRLTGDGAVVWVHGSAYCSKDKSSDDIMLYYYASNINEKKLLEQSHRQRAEYDGLTGIYNNVTAELLIREAMEADVKNGISSALLLITLNGLKETRVEHGDFFADVIISDFACKLNEISKEGEIAGKCGENNFLIYIRDMQDTDTTLKKAEGICAANDEIFRGCDVGLTIGISLLPTHGSTLGILYKNAGSACQEGECKNRVIRLYNKPEVLSADNSLETAYSNEEWSPKGGLIGRVFSMLYESEDFTSSITGALELVAKAFEFNRGYVFNVELDGTALCAFEYCDEGISRIPDEWRSMSQKRVESLKEIFADNDMHIQNDAKNKEYGENTPSLRILYCFKDSAKIRGFVGFNYAVDNADLTGAKRNTLQSVLRIFGVFLAGRAVNHELYESGILLQSIVDDMHSCTYIIDPISHIIKYINKNTRELMPKAVPGKCCYEILRGRASPCTDCPIDRMVRDNTKADKSEMYLDGFKTWARVNASLVTMPDGQVFGVFNSFDFSEKYYEMQSLDTSHFMQDTSLYAALSMSTDDYIIVCDMTTNCYYFPPKMVEEFNLPSQIITDAIPIWQEYIHSDDRADFLSDIEQMFNGKTDTHNQEYRAKNKNGEWVWLRARGHVERNSEGVPTMFAVVLTNLGRKSKVDHLTGLLDKYEFEVSTRAELAEGVTQGVLLLLGLDNFKYINNIYGWEFGDNVLKESSLRLLSTLPEKAGLYRLDGDKFGVFLPYATVEEVEDYYRKLFSAFRQHRQFGEHRYYCTISGGYTYFKDDVPTFGNLYKQANCALDTSKREGKNRLTAYDDRTMSGNRRMLAMMSALHDSVERGCEGFELYFQPQTESETLKVNSAEVLLRWKTEEFGMISPTEFIPLLEQSGLINRVGHWVIINASKVCRKWRETIPDFTISINISFVQLQDQSFLPFLERQVEQGNINPGMLHLEITESCIVDGSLFLRDAVTKLRGMGFLIEMDDFGTGYSSLEILKNAPADVVKIDQTFVRGITNSKFDATFIRIIVELCHSVGINVCLEGVETKEEYELVKVMDLDLIQGFYFGMPQPEEDFTNKFILSL